MIETAILKINRTSNKEEVFHVYLNKFEISVTLLFLITCCNN